MHYYRLRLFFSLAIAVLVSGGISCSGGSGSVKIPKGMDETALVIPEDNQLTKAKIELGKLLYFDTRLSPDNSVGCVSCHNPDFGFTDGQPVSTGIDGQQGGRSAPTVINRVFSSTQFWDGRAPSLEEQAKGPLTNPIEHGFKNNDAVVAKVSSIKGYRELFKKAFNREVNLDDLAKAIASFERTVISGNSRFDKYKMGDKNALNEEELAGMRLFFGKGACAGCHSGPNFTNEDYHNIGVGMNAENPDLGRYAVTGNEEDKGAFKTPTLRDITRTAPYMHDGSLETLEDVVRYYDAGGFANPYLHPLMSPLNLSDNEIGSLVAFMKALDGEGWQKIRPPDSFPQ